MWMAQSVGNRLSRAVLRMVPVLLVGALIPGPYGLRRRRPVFVSAYPAPIRAAAQNT